MKKLIALLSALLIVMALCLPALAETAVEAAETAVAEAAEAVEGAAEDAADAVEEAAEQVEETVEEAAAQTEEVVEGTAEQVEEAAEEAAEQVEEAVEEEAPAKKKGIFDEFGKLPWYTWALLAVLVAAAAILGLGSANNRWTSRRIAMGAMCIAIAFVLSCIRLFRMPQGGSITPAAMLPLVMFMVACGPVQGFAVGCAYGLLQLITDPYVIHPVQMLVDYPLAYGAMILGCLALPLPVKKQWKLPIAVLLAGVGRYLMAVLSGSIFFAEYAGEQNAWIYSLVYNISYLGPDTLVCMAVACIPGMWRLVEMIRGKR